MRIILRSQEDQGCQSVADASSVPNNTTCSPQRVPSTKIILVFAFSRSVLYPRRATPQRSTCTQPVTPSASVSASVVCFREPPGSTSDLFSSQAFSSISDHLSPSSLPASQTLTDHYPTLESRVLYVCSFRASTPHLDVSGFESSA